MASSGKVLGRFGKGTAGSVAINFGVSGGVHCDLGCVHNPNSTARGATGACYAVRFETQGARPQLVAQLQRHEAMPPALIVGRALVERDKTPAWIRFSTSGSLPQPRKASRLFLAQLRALLGYARGQGIPVHIPVESGRKCKESSPTGNRPAGDCRVRTCAQAKV